MGVRRELAEGVLAGSESRLKSDVPRIAVDLGECLSSRVYFRNCRQARATAITRTKVVSQLVTVSTFDMLRTCPLPGVITKAV